MSSRVDFFETHMGDVEILGASFGTIGYSLKTFWRVYWDSGPFFDFGFLARYSKTANFRGMVPTLRSTFFSISYQIAYSLFWGVDLFCKFSLLSLPVQTPRVIKYANMLIYYK